MELPKAFSVRDDHGVPAILALDDTAEFKAGGQTDRHRGYMLTAGHTVFWGLFTWNGDPPQQEEGGNRLAGGRLRLRAQCLDPAALVLTRPLLSQRETSRALLRYG